ncbi:TlpA disulfide reductase family protein [Ferrovibrio sp.]|uniref:TlpA family protein disulfide reductase n=1 Tax=Ferrovibrio sp. TaxID=1917215 RepID=UPI00311ED8C0
MKPQLVLTLLLLFVPGLSDAAQSSDALVPPGFAIHDRPRPIHQVEFVTHDGSATNLSDFRGSTVLLNIWATWCPPCREEMPSLDSLQSRLGGKGFQVVALSIDRAGMPAVETFFRESGIRFLSPFLDSSGKVSRALGITGLPTTLLINTTGQEIGRLVGPAQWDAPEMIAFLERYRQ